MSASLQSVELDVGHLGDEVAEGGFWFPAEKAFRFAGVADKVNRLHGAHETGILFDKILPFETHSFERDLNDVLDAVKFAGGEDEGGGLVVLKGQPHAFDVIASVTPIAFGS